MSDFRDPQQAQIFKGGRNRFVFGIGLDFKNDAKKLPILAQAADGLRSEFSKATARHILRAENLSWGMVPSNIWVWDPSARSIQKEIAP